MVEDRAKSILEEEDDNCGWVVLWGLGLTLEMSWISLGMSCAPHGIVRDGAFIGEGPRANSTLEPG